MSDTRSLASRLQAVTLRELGLFLQACRLGWTAQRITRGISLESVIETLLAKKQLPKDLDEDDAVVAASRAGRRLQSLGLLNTCLIRTLVAGTLLADRDDVTLRLGFRQGEAPQETPDGHAWLTLGTRILPHPNEALAPNGDPYLVMASFPIRRPS
jgi:hypothetical protein